MELKDIVKYVAAIGGSLVTYLFGEWSALIQILVAFVVIDYVTGVLDAAINNKLSNNISFEGSICLKERYLFSCSLHVGASCWII